jgi:flagellar motor component MotA
MPRDEFIAEYYKVSARAMQLSEKARKEGLLALDDLIDFKKVDQRDIFEYGLIFVIDGTDASVIRDILSLIIKQEEDKYARRLMDIKAEAVLSIQSWDHPRILASKLNAHTDIALADDLVTQKLKEERDNTGKLTDDEIDALIGGVN